MGAGRTIGTTGIASGSPVGLALAVLGVLLLAGLLLAPSAAVAAAKPGDVVYPAHKELEFGARGTNGYGIFFIGEERGKLTVLVDKGANEVTYELPAQWHGDHFEAHYGKVIDISVRFHPRAGSGPLPDQPLQGRCVGRKSVTSRGEFVGRIEFRGERGYTRLITTRHRASVEHNFKKVCRKRSFRPAVGSAIAEGPEQIVAARSAGPTETWFRAVIGLSAKLWQQWTFEVRRAERVGRVRIERLTILEEENGATLSASGVLPVTAEIAPTTPFSGSAEFRQEATGATSWTGSLGDDLPGLGVVPLTGEGFTAVSCVGEGEKATRPCKRSPLAPVYP